MRQLSLLSFVLILIPATVLAQQSPPPDRNSVLLQTLQAQVAALDGANRLCQMDASEIKKQLDEMKAKEKKE
jgi:hypothetical protein